MRALTYASSNSLCTKSNQQQSDVKIQTQRNYYQLKNHISSNFTSPKQQGGGMNDKSESQFQVQKL